MEEKEKRGKMSKSKKELEQKKELSESMDNLDPIENTNKSKDENRNDREKNTTSWSDSNGDIYIVSFDIENKIFESEIKNDRSFLSQLESSFYRNFGYLNKGSKSDDSDYDRSTDDTQYSYYINSYIESFLHSQIPINTYIVSGNDNYIESYIESYIYSFISSESENGSESENSSESGNSSESENSSESPNDLDGTQKYKHLWVLCENCYELNYKQFLKMNICEHCGYHLKMNSSERIELLIDSGTWDPMDEDMVSLDPDSEEKTSQELQNELNEDFEEILLDFAKLKLNENISNSFEKDSEGRSKDLEKEAMEKYLKKRCERISQELDEIIAKFSKDKDLEEEPSPDSTESPDYPDSTESTDYPDSTESPDSPESPDSTDYPDSEEEEEKSYKDRLDSYQNETGLTEAVQTGIGQINGIPVAFGVMDFDFMGGSMGSVVGEKITRLIEYATNNFLPLIIVCASGGARMQEGSLSLMQMAKISSALFNYQKNKKLFYVSILTSPTTGGVTASFGMLGDIIIAEPNAYIAFAGKRVIEETLKITVPEGLQETEYLFEKGLFDLIVPRNLLKSVLSELFQFHDFFSLNQNSIK